MIVRSSIMGDNLLLHCEGYRSQITQTVSLSWYSTFDKQLSSVSGFGVQRQAFVERMLMYATETLKNRSKDAEALKPSQGTRA